MTKESIGGRLHYTINRNNMQAFFAKYPTGIVPKKPTGTQIPSQLEPKAEAKIEPKVVRKTRAKPRSPLIMAIDNEIAQCEYKLSQLKRARKNFDK